MSREHQQLFAAVLGTGDRAGTGDHVGRRMRRRRWRLPQCAAESAGNIVATRTAAPTAACTHAATSTTGDRCSRGSNHQLFRPLCAGCWDYGEYGEPAPIAGVLVKEGGGTLKITNMVAFTNSAQINAGTIWLDGSPTSGFLASDVYINPLGTLWMDGTVTRSVFNQGSMRVFNTGAPTEQGGSPRIGGNYTQSSSGTLIAHLNTDFRIAGNVILQGGTLDIRLPVGGTFGYSLTPQILHADGTISGQFGKVVVF